MNSFCFSQDCFAAKRNEAGRHQTNFMESLSRQNNRKSTHSAFPRFVAVLIVKGRATCGSARRDKPSIPGTPSTVVNGARGRRGPMLHWTDSARRHGRRCVTRAANIGPTSQTTKRVLVVPACLPRPTILILPLLSNAKTVLEREQNENLKRLLSAKDRMHAAPARAYPN